MTESAGAEATQDARLNARIDRLPTWGLSPVVFAVFGLLFFFVYYDIAVIGATLPTLTEDLDLSAAETKVIVAANLIAYIIGAFALGNVADRVGRRKALIYSILILTAGAIITALSWNAPSLIAFRFFTGLGQGALISLAITMVGEFSPAWFRGRYTAYSAIFGAVGIVLPAFIAIPLLRIPGSGWRILFGLGALVVILLIFFRDRWMPESPRWLAMYGQNDRADRIVSRMEERVRNVTGTELPAVPNLPAEGAGSGFPMLQLFRSPYLSRVVLVFFFWSVFYMWVYAFLTFEPTILGELGIDLPSSLLYTGLGELGFIVAGIIQPFLIDRLERKYLIAGGIGIAVIGFALLGASSSAAGVIIAGFVITFGDFVVVFPAYTYTAEIFPTRARASGMAIGDGLGHIGAAIQPFIIIPVLGAVGPRGTFWFIGFLALVSLVIILGGIRTVKLELTKLAR